MSVETTTVRCRIKPRQIRMPNTKRTAGSYAMPASDSEKELIGQELTDAVIAKAGEKAMKPARTMDNTDLDVYWRRKVAPVYVARALAACK